MSRTVPPIPPPLGTNTRNDASPNRVDTIINDNINNTTTTNVAQNVVNEDLPKFLDSRGGSHVTNVPEFDKEDFSSWKDRFLVYLDRLEPYLLEVLKNRPFVPMLPLSTFTNQLTKPQKQWSHEDRKLANQDKRIKSIIISCLPNNVMKSVIKYTTAKAMWIDLVLAYEGPSDTSDTKIAALILKFNDFKALEWNIHKAKMLDSDSDVEEDTMSSGKFLADLNVEFHDRALLGKIEKGLVAESFDWDEESISFEDERVTKVKAFMAIIKDELSVGKADARSCGRGEGKETISSKEVMFTKADESPAETASKITSEFESEYSGCSRHMTGVKQYLHRYSKKSGPKVVFGDNSLRDTKGYGLVNCNGITFTRGTIFNQNNEVVLIAPRRRDVYFIDMSSYNEEINVCFFTIASNSVNWLCHKRPFYLNFKNISKLARKNLVVGLPSLTFSKDKTCPACKKGSTIEHHSRPRDLFPSVSAYISFICICLDLLNPKTISHNNYTLVIVDEYSRKMENLNEARVKELRSDNGIKFKHQKLEEFCEEKGISQNFSSPCTPDQNGGEAVNTACYTQSRSIIVKRHKKITYDVFRGRSPNISHYVFGCPVHIHNQRDHLGKFNEKVDDGFFLGYSPVAKAFRVFNIRRQEMEEQYHVTFSKDNEAISKSIT
nr:hypothetical protein [Tanacetum cinerariifolium]